MCRETHVHFFLRATISTLNATTDSPVDTDISTVPCERNTVPRRTSKEHTEHSRKSVHPLSATSKTNQAHVTCSHPAGRTADPRSCGNNCLVHVEVGRRRTRRSTRGGWGRGAFADGECGMERTLGVEKRSWRGCVHMAGGKARQWQGAAVGRDGMVALGGRAAKRQRVTRKLAVASGGRRRHG